MKHLIKLLPILLGLMFATTSCVVDWDDDDWDEHEYCHNDDWAIKDYMQRGYWYPEYKSGLTPCEYDSYFYFTHSSVYWYDCHGEMYDYGTYEIYDGYLNIRYHNGDRDRFDVIDWSHDHLVLRAHDGTEFYYERHY